jgi:heme/copper-type cytochrome/quinol oxidase subunit 1
MFKGVGFIITKIHKMNLKNKPYNLLLLFSLLFAVTGFFFYNTIIDIHVHDTYFVMQHAFLFWSGTVILLLLWGISFLTNRTLFASKLVWIHIVLTIGAVIIICASPFLNDTHKGVAGTPRRYYDTGSLFLKTIKEFSGIAFGIGLFFLAQLILFLNLLLGLFLKKKTGKNLME